MKNRTAVARWRYAVAAGWVLVGLLDPATSRADLFGHRSQRLQDSFGSTLAGFALPNDNLGQALASGDFDGDGRDDLAIADYESLTGEKEGSVHLLYGIQGPVSPNTQIRDFDPATGASDREIGDGFGEALAAGDFNGDGFVDLAIGIPYEDAGLVPDVGAVLVLYGSQEGLVVAGAPSPQRYRVGADGLFGTPHADDRWASALAAGDFDHDGRDDLAVGCPRCDAFTFQLPVDAGGVWILYGSATGLSTVGEDHFDQDSVDALDGAPMLNSCEEGDRFGRALAAGDFDGDLADDLAVGVPEEGIGAAGAAGAVQVLYGQTGAGLRVTRNQFWNESNVATTGAPEAGDGFGLRLAAGDVTGEGIADLAIGAPREDVGALEDAGAVTLLWGQLGNGLDTPGSEIYDESQLANVGFPAAFENFGSTLAIGDFVEQNARGALDLVIGAAQEEVLDPVTLLTVPLAGAFVVVPGGFGLDPNSAQFWMQGTRSIAGGADLAAGNAFAYALAAGDFDGDGHHDLAVGAPFVDGTTSPGVPTANAGAVYLIFGALFADGFGSGDLAAWSVSAP